MRGAPQDPCSEMQHKPKPHYPIALMLLVLLLAASFYAFQLDAVSFWEDESWMAIAISDGPAQVWDFAIRNGVHPPLYFYLAWAWAQLCGDSEFSLRWLGALVSLLGIAWTYRLGRDLGDWRSGVLAALLAACSMWLIYLTRLARHYSLFYTLSVILVWFYWRWLNQPQPQRRTLFLLAVSQAALLYTHYYGAWLGMVLGLHALWVLRSRRWLEYVLAMAGAGLIFLPWVPAIVAQLRSTDRGLTYAIADAGLALMDYNDRITNALLPLGLLMALAGLRAIWGRPRLRSLMFCWLLLSFVPVLAINAVFPWFISRNMLFTLPGVLLLYSLGLLVMLRWPGGRIMAAFCVLAFAINGLLALPNFWPVTLDWRGMVPAIAEETLPEDRFVIVGEPYSLDYYLRRLYGRRYPILRESAWLAQPQTDGPVWFVNAGPPVESVALDLLPVSYERSRQILQGTLLAERYQVGPQAVLARFGDVLSVAYTGPALRSVMVGEMLGLDLWWRAEAPLTEDYSVTLQLIGSDGLLFQADAGFDRGRVSSGVLPLQVWLADSREFRLPQDMPPGRYALMLGVYNWRNGERLPLPGAANDLIDVMILDIH